MLVILVGATLDAGKNSRSYFEGKGYSIIKKYTYRPEDSVVGHCGDGFIEYPLEDVERCDFKYTIHGGMTGFYKAQIIDAVRGRSNALITASPDNLDFIRQVKDSFGEYVITIYLYIDKYSLEKMTRKVIENETGVKMRLEKGKSLRKIYTENMSLFDEKVIYSTDDEFGFDALYSQYDRIIEEAKELEKILNERLYVGLPYKGNKEYIFVSYSHKDEKTVLPYLSALQKEGYRIWYDEGINKGSNWNVFLGERLRGCTDFLLFSSQNSVASDRVEDEINGAKMCRNIKPITVRLDESVFPFGYEMYLNKYQNIFANGANAVSEIKNALNPSTKTTHKKEDSAN